MAQAAHSTEPELVTFLGESGGALLSELSAKHGLLPTQPIP